MKAAKRSQRRELAEFFLGKGLSECTSASLAQMLPAGLQYKCKPKNDREVSDEMIRISDDFGYLFGYCTLCDLVRNKLGTLNRVDMGITG